MNNELQLQQIGIVVDDDLSQAELAAEALTNEGYPSKAFSDIKKALEFAEAKRAGLVFAIFDLSLGQDSGADYARRFRKEGLGALIFLLTAYRDSLKSIECEDLERLGITILDKPMMTPGSWTKLMTMLDPYRQRISPSSPVAADPIPNGDPSSSSPVASTNTFEPAKRQPIRWSRLGYITAFLACGILLVWILVSRSHSGSPASQAVSESENQSPKVILAEHAFPQSALTIIAQRNGYFKKHGLDVKVKQEDSGRNALATMLNGVAQFATVAETPVVFAGFGGKPVVIIATISASDDSCKVAASRASHIRMPSDLKGKKVATVEGTSADFFMEVFLKHNGLSREDVNVIPMDPGQMPTALSNQEIDAFFIWEPHILAARANPNTFTFRTAGIYTEMFNVATQRKYAESNPEIVRKFLEALIEAKHFVDDYSVDASKIVAEKTRFEPKDLQEEWEKYRISVSLDQTLIDAMENEARWAKESKRVGPNAAISDIRDLIDPEPLRKIDRDVVSIK